jgi:ubiquinone/menaquinone biosynthesis C-methylase UbiE
MAMHHFPDQQGSFSEIARVLKPGGIMVVVDINPKTFLGKLARFFENSIMRSHLSFWRLRPDGVAQTGGPF